MSITTVSHRTKKATTVQSMPQEEQIPNNIISFQKMDLQEVPYPILATTTIPGTEIVEVNLSENRLKKISLPNLTLQFPNLQRLALGNNELMGSFGKGISGGNWKRELVWLDFTYNHISSLDEEIKDLQALVSLGASDCRLRELPDWLGGMTGMRKIGLFNNLLTEIPASMGGLVNLTKLDLSGNRLQQLPKEIGRLTKLTWLNLSNNQIEHLPQEIENLTNLRELGLASNKLKTLPYLGKMKNLHLLTAFTNLLEGDPLGDAGVQELTTSMQRIDLSSNNIHSIPTTLIENLPLLELLNLRNNKLTTFKVSKKITNESLVVDVRDNELQELPSLLWRGEVDLKCSNNPFNNNDGKRGEGMPVKQPTPSLHLMALQVLSTKKSINSTDKQIIKSCHLCEQQYYHKGWVWRESRQMITAKMSDSQSSLLSDAMIPFVMEICGAKCYNRLCREDLDLDLDSDSDLNEGIIDV